MFHSKFSIFLLFCFQKLFFSHWHYSEQNTQISAVALIIFHTGHSDTGEPPSRDLYVLRSTDVFCCTSTVHTLYDTFGLRNSKIWFEMDLRWPCSAPQQTNSFPEVSNVKWIFLQCADGFVSEDVECGQRTSYYCFYFSLFLKSALLLWPPRPSFTYFTWRFPHFKRGHTISKNVICAFQQKTETTLLTKCVEVLAPELRSRRPEASGFKSHKQLRHLFEWWTRIYATNASSWSKSIFPPTHSSRFTRAPDPAAAAASSVSWLADLWQRFVLL